MKKIMTMLFKLREHCVWDINSKKILKINLFFFIFFFGFINFAYSLNYKEIKNCYFKSYVYEKNKNYKKAIQVLMPVYKTYPDGYTVNLRLGWLYYLNKNYANSEFHYKKALKSIPSSIEALLGLSLPYIAKQDWKKVENLMYKILKIDFYNYYGNLRLSIALRNQGNFAAAESIARKMLSIYPTDINFLTELALSLYYQNKKQKAYSVFSDILILDPENFTAKKFLSTEK